MDRAVTFATTHWSVILAAQQPDAPGCHEALEQLCETYWYPLYAFVRRQGRDPEEARDLTQAFFTRFLEKDYLRAVQPAKGKFRTFLLTAMGHFLVNDWIHSRRQKRGGSHQLVSLDDQSAEARYRLEPVDNMTAERIFERRWAMTVLQNGMNHLRTECLAAGKGALFDELKGHLAGEKAARTLGAIACRLDLTEGALKAALHRLRRRYGELVRAEIAKTVTSQAEVDQELQFLFQTLRS